MDYNYISDKTNIKIYSKYGLKDTESTMYKCASCGEPTSIDESFSNRGHKLICRRCAEAKFDSMWEILEWMRF